MDEFLEISSDKHKTGKIRGFYLAIVSLAWVLAQGFSGTILNNFSFTFLYFISFIIMIVIFIASFFALRNISDPKYDKKSALGSLKIFFKNKNLARSYKINFLLQFFYSIMIIYTPLYLNKHLGFTWGEVGMIFTIMLTPFVILPFFLGKYADKIGERKMLMLGFTIISLATLSLFFIKQHEIWIWTLLLFITRTGASTIEIMIDVYFFKHITPEKDELIGIYRNTAPIAYIFAPLIAFLSFTFTPSFNFIYIVLGVFMLYGIYLSSAIRKNDI